MIKIESKLESNKCVKEKKAGDACPASMPVLHSYENVHNFRIIDGYKSILYLCDCLRPTEMF